jgi:phosphoribosyl 1,2-cyclic phosphodiesterase
MKVRFWGVRGSIPVPGPQTNRYGGNTSCVEIEAPEHDPIVIDAGTGIRRLGKELTARNAGRPCASHVLISHTHWDHIQGLPYFSPLYADGNHLHVYARQRDDTHLRAIFASQNQGPYFPVPLGDLRAGVEFHELVEGMQFQIGRARVTCTRLNHPWIAMAYRVELDGAVLVYASDTAPFTDILFAHEFIAVPPRPGEIDPSDAAKLREMRASLVALCRDADLLIYDTQFTPEEYRAKPHWGHSTPDDAIAIAREAGVRKLALYHYAPARTDDEQDAIVAHYRAALVGGPLEMIAAYEGLEVDVRGSR